MTGETATRVLLADDQELIRAGLRMMVDSAPDLNVVGEAATGRQAGRMAREERADVVLMDIRMPDLDGLEATRQIVADENLAGVKVLILTTFEVDEYVFEALRSGASGFLGKGSRPDVLIEAIRTVARGDALLSPAATRGLITRFLTMNDPGPAAPGLLDALTDREREIVALVATGMSNAEIAGHLTLSPLTVKTHANHAMTKLGARDRAQRSSWPTRAAWPVPSPRTSSLPALLPTGLDGPDPSPGGQHRSLALPPQRHADEKSGSRNSCSLRVRHDRPVAQRRRRPAV